MKRCPHLLSHPSFRCSDIKTLNMTIQCSKQNDTEVENECRMFWMALSSLEGHQIQIGVLYEPQWDTKSLSVLIMLPLVTRIVEENIITVCVIFIL